MDKVTRIHISVMKSREGLAFILCICITQKSSNPSRVSNEAFHSSSPTPEMFKVRENLKTRDGGSHAVVRPLRRFTDVLRKKKEMKKKREKFP